MKAIDKARGAILALGLAACSPGSPSTPAASQSGCPPVGQAEAVLPHQAPEMSDPPYFVFGAVRPLDSQYAEFAGYLIVGGAGARDAMYASDLNNYERRDLDGKQVYVGTLEMLNQDDHQRGRPYLYMTEDHLFEVITDDDEWALDALSQLP